jgi:flavorubredoxin
MNDAEPVAYDKPVEIAEGVHWVGFWDEHSRLHCNPYLIVEGQEAVLIDAGSRSDFSSVMMKILQTGINPHMIRRLIYHHYDPDLCGSIPNFETIIGRDDLKIISHRANNIFIKYYGVSSPRLCIETMQWEFRFATGRTLTFVRTPYAHAEGSFVTFDHQTGTLFSSDLFGSYDQEWDLFLRLHPSCATCDLSMPCRAGRHECPLRGIIEFHTNLMTSTAALQFALQQIEHLPIQRIAPQHGSVIDRDDDVCIVLERLRGLQPVGIDRYGEEVREHA